MISTYIQSTEILHVQKIFFSQMFLPEFSLSYLIYIIHEKFIIITKTGQNLLKKLKNSEKISLSYKCPTAVL